MSLVVPPRSRSTLRRLVATSIALLAAPSLASAAPYEQVTPATADGSPPSYNSRPSAVGDVGRFVGFNAGGARVRDIQTNTVSQPGGPATDAIVGMDRLERTVLVHRTFADRSELALVPLTGGGASRVLYTVRPATGLWTTDAALSTDGTTVIVNDRSALELRAVDTATAKVATLERYDEASTLQPVSRNGLSTNGGVYLGADPAIPEQGKVYIRSAAGAWTGKGYHLPASGVLSGDGTTVVWTVGGSVASSRYAASTTTFQKIVGPPGSATGAEVARVSPDGAMAVLYAYVPSYGVPAQPALSVNVKTGAASVYGGRYSTSLVGPSDPNGVYGFTLFGPSGRFALVPISQQLAIVDVTDTHIVGANDPFSGDIFTAFFTTVQCSGTPYGLGIDKFWGTMILRFRRPVTWIPLPQKAVTTLIAGTTVVKTTPVANQETITVAWNGRPATFTAKTAITLADGTVVNAKNTRYGYYYTRCYG